MPDDFTRISIYVPLAKQTEKPLERLVKLGQKRDRSLNYMIIAAILDYVEREEKKMRRKK
jgi:predicted transcriptional regulator